MKLCILAIALTVVLLLSLPVGAALAKARITAGEPTPLKDLRSLGDVIAGAKNGRVHIIYVHGMRAEEPGASAAFRNKLTQSFGIQGKVIKEPRHRLNLQPWPKGARVGDTPIWDTETDWFKGQPFIDRYTLKTLKHDVTVTIDEVNWWPLVFPLKCRMLLKPEGRIAGVDRPHLKLCYDDVEPYHRWISPADYAEAIAAKPALGGAAFANKYLKQQIMDWGMSDAVITTGPMRVYLNAAIDAAFAHASNTRGVTSEYVLIAESLGGFIVLDAYAEDKPAVRDVLNATHNLYFFANQFALLELSRITNLPVVANNEPKEFVSSGALALRQTQSSPLTALCEWAAALPAAEFLPPKSAVKQIIAFSDPSDALTFRVPEFATAKVSNVYVRNAGSLLGLVADPIKAHSAQMQNAALWDAMVRENSPPPPVAGPVEGNPCSKG